MCDGSCLAGIDRRTLLARGGLALAGILLAACGSDATGPELAEPFTVRLADHPALASVGGVALVTGPGNDPIAIVRIAETQYLALSRTCPHQGNLINPSGNGFLCSGHGAQFEKDGNWVGGQETSDMRRLKTSLDGQGATLTIG